MVQISKAVIAKFIQRNIKSPVSDQIANVIVSNCNSDVLNGIINMLLTEDRISVFEPNDYFKIKAPYGHKSKYFFEDKLIDLGLIENGYVFGQIIKSNDWHNEHDCYHHSMKCNLFYGEETPYQDNLSIFEMIKIEKSQIPHFNGTYIPRIIDRALERVSDLEENDISE